MSFKNGSYYFKRQETSFFLEDDSLSWARWSMLRIPIQECQGRRITTLRPTCAIKWVWQEEEFSRSSESLGLFLPQIGIRTVQRVGFLVISHLAPDTLRNGFLHRQTDHPSLIWTSASYPRALCHNFELDGSRELKWFQYPCRFRVVCEAAKEPRVPVSHTCFPQAAWLLPTWGYTWHTS